MSSLNAEMGLVFSVENSRLRCYRVEPATALVSYREIVSGAGRTANTCQCSYMLAPWKEPHPGGSHFNLHIPAVTRRPSEMVASKMTYGASMICSGSRIASVLRIMILVRLGNSGLNVSRIILGCGSYGSSEWDSWVLGEEEAFKHIKFA